MAAYRANGTALLASPVKDHYDGNQLVPPHFSYTPDLIPVALVYKCHGLPTQDEIWAPIAHDIGRKARTLYEKHHLKVHSKTKAGLYVAGSHEDLEDHERDRMKVLVFELEVRESHRWRDIDEDARALLKDLEKVRGREHGICVRYYRRHQRRRLSGGDGATRSLPSTQELLPTASLHHVDESSVRTLPRVHLPTNDTRQGSRSARRTVNHSDSRTELTPQRQEDRYRDRADGELFREDRIDSLQPPSGESGDPDSNDDSTRGWDDDEESSGLDSDSEFPRPRSHAQQYGRLARTIEERQRRQTEFIRAMGLANHDMEEANHDDSWSDDTADEQARRENDSDEQRSGSPLRSISARDIPAETSRAVAYLRSMTRRDHERQFEERHD